MGTPTGASPLDPTGGPLGYSPQIKKIHVAATATRYCTCDDNTGIESVVFSSPKKCTNFNVKLRNFLGPITRERNFG